MSHAHLPTRLYLLRHGEVEETYHRVFGGKIDMNLSGTGHKQAEKLATWLHPRIPIDAIYVSPMKRAQQTVIPLAKATSLEPVTLNALHEVDFGDWTGLSWEEVHTKFGVSAFDWLKHMEAYGFPGGESVASFKGRLKPCLQQIVAAQPGKTVAVVCHGGVIRMLLAILLDLDIQSMGGFEIDYASATRVDYRELKSEVQFLNLTPWRDFE